MIGKILPVVLIILTASFLRFYELSNLMAFIPDQGWFYLSARDMLLTGIIPLIGPPTSHPWIHHGPLWTYMLAFLLWIGHYDPIFPGYFVAFLGVVTVFMFYKVVGQIFGRNVALASSILYATSPLIVMNSRIPYHTSPIPFFVILLFFSTYKWVIDNAWYFPFIIFLLAILYNHEITTFVYAIAIGVLFLYGFIKRKTWTRRVLRVSVMATSLLLFFIPMIPFILYDVGHGYKQTVGFLLWVVYRLVKLPLSIVHPSFQSPGSNPSTIPEFLGYYQQLIFAYSGIISFFAVILTTLFLYVYIRKSLQLTIKTVSPFVTIKKLLHDQFNEGLILLFLFLGVGCIGLFVHRIPIEADTLLIAPFLIILFTLSVVWVCREKLLPVFLMCILIASYNLIFLLSTEYMTNMGKNSRITFAERIVAVEKVIELSQKKPYKIVGEGELSDFSVFLMPYEYLLWWKGSYPKSFGKSITINEKNGNVYIESK